MQSVARTGRLSKSRAFGASKCRQPLSGPFSPESYCGGTPGVIQEAQVRILLGALGSAAWLEQRVSHAARSFWLRVFLDALLMEVT